MKKNLFFVFISLFSLSCISRKTDLENLPKDISLKPKDSILKDSLRTDKPVLKNLSVTEQELFSLKKEIEDLISKTSCTQENQWRIAPMGTKPCGGPTQYIAYPIAIENDIIEKIHLFTHKQDEYNKENNIMSDCAMVLPPSGITCVAGEAVLIQTDHKEN